MNDMDRRDWETAEQFRDECERMRDVIEALEKAERAGTPKEAVIVLADECGVGEFYRKHHTTT